MATSYYSTFKLLQDADSERDRDTMSHYTSPPPPYQQHASKPQTFHPHSHGHGYGRQPSIHIVVPTSPISRTVIHSRYNENDHLLSGGRRRRNNGPGCCFFTVIILGAVLIFAVFSIVQFVLSMPINKAVWTNLESRSCTTYATREYLAKINVSTWNRHWMDTCMTTPLFVHDHPNWPFRCEDRSGTVVGHFAINYDEPDCVTYWSRYKDRGCTAKGSKTRRIEQHLMNVPKHADYKEFCATTPARFLGQEFSGAESCVHSIWGVYGQWFIDDPRC
ncbi:hypothetical protein DEU56DRAFT_817086 [Suillus clintonianus]|uniref:uncharacterized protein n=1 Tax=Suillus clintonianus TaxID=1904413 RepID=UPI001B85E14E|nr:uncharacterized protein DEU56DRAFT_817086 [Suillus clintonianus]KAG2129623.1 hypothetical protein DEU56DRAFT_817086 [Suillus clintonianus]